MINKDYIYSMNDEEIKEAIKLLSQAIKENKIEFEHYNPIQENCYISSGEYEGIYFPNTLLTIEPDLKVICVCKYKGELGILYEYTEAKKEHLKEIFKRDFNLIDFTSFYYLLYAYEERQIIEQLQKELSPLYEAIEVINNIKYQYKKDGTPFKNIAKSFEYETDKKRMTTYINRYGYLELILTDKEKNKSYCFDTLEKPSETVLEALTMGIKNRYNQILENIKDYEQDIKNIHQISDTISKINSLAKSFSYPTRLKIKELIRL